MKAGDPTLMVAHPMSRFAAALRLLSDLGKFLRKRPGLVLRVDARRIALVDNVQLTHVLLNRQRLNSEHHRRLVARHMMLVPNALADIERVAWLPVDALIIQQTVTLTPQHDNNGFVMLVCNRMGMRRVDMAIDFNDAILEAKLLRDQWPHPDTVLRLPFQFDIFSLDKFSSGFAPRDVGLDSFSTRFKQTALSFKPFCPIVIRHGYSPFLCRQNSSPQY